MRAKIDINRKLILFIVGAFMIIIGVFLLLPGLMSLCFGEGDYYVYFTTALSSALCGGALTWFCRDRKSTMTKQDSYLTVVTIWIVFALIGLVPYLWGGHLDSFANAFFESMSGITTTGATLMPNVEAASHGILLWRSLTQWLGGMGVITLALILLPAMGIGGMQLFTAEASVTRNDKIHPKITEMAKSIWVIYAALTLCEVLLLVAGGMSIFDAVCHSLSTLSTGGFSTKVNSIEFFDSAYIEYIVMLFMYIGGINFVLFYSVILGKGSRLFADDELKYYTVTFVVVSLVSAAILLVNETYDNAEEALRDSAFQVLSVMTSTGFTTSNYILWPPAIITILALLMLSGTCTGSTSGGIKFMRLTIMSRNVSNELKRTLHPTAVVPVKYNGKSVASADVQNVLMFIVLYIVILFAGVVLISLGGYDFEDSFGLAANSLGNIGITIGSYGYTASLCDLTPMVKFIMAALMLIGRLEIYTVILLFSPAFWRR